MPSPVEAGPARERRWGWALLGIALGLRLAFVLTQSEGFLFFDSVEFDRAARSFLEQGRFNRAYDHLPAYPIFMAGVYRVFGTGIVPFRIVQAFLSCGLCLVVWLLGRRLFGSRAGLLALTACALFPLQIVLAGIEYPIVIGSLLIWGALLLQCVRTGGRARDSAALLGAGILAGLACLTFEAGWAAAVFIFCWILVRDSAWSSRLRDAGLFAAVVVVTAIPFLTRMARVDDFRPVIKRAGVHLPAAPGSKVPLARGSGSNLVIAKLEAMARRPGFTLRHISAEFLRFWSPYPDRLQSASPDFRERAHAQDPRMRVDNPLVGSTPRTLYAVGFSLLLAMAALGGWMAYRKVPGSGFVAGWPVALGLAYAPFFTQMRYRIPADPAFLLLAAYAVDQLMEGDLVKALRSLPAALWEGWKRVAVKIAVAQTFLLLFLLFGVVLGPISLLMRLFRKDPMEGVKGGASFWVVRERTRENLQECLRQF